jgi:hypothetical protein
MLSTKSKISHFYSHAEFRPKIMIAKAIIMSIKEGLLSIGGLSVCMNSILNPTKYYLKKVRREGKGLRKYNWEGANLIKLYCTCLWKCHN